MGRFLRFCIPRARLSTCFFSPASSMDDHSGRRGVFRGPHASQRKLQGLRVCPATQTQRNDGAAKLTLLFRLVRSHSIVEYSSPDEAQKAISSLTNKTLEGRQVFVREVSAAVMALKWDSID